jgi:hypothetical protein
MDGQVTFTDRSHSEWPELPVSLVADGGDRPVGYRLVRGEPGTEWRYVLDPAVADAYMAEMWGVEGARAYERTLAEAVDARCAWEAARDAQRGSD